MIIKFGFFFLVTIIACLALLSNDVFPNNDLKILLDNSRPYIGADVPSNFGFNGDGIKIAVIDTGVDYNHPDLLGFGEDGKVVGGYDYVDNDNWPLDTNGHGTEVAGIIAADGALRGIAPKSKILAYRVSDDGESVPTDLIIKAINQAVVDDVDIINISLGINKTNKKIDEAVNNAIDNGIVVITAAGNNGPGLSTIGSPGINPNTITVGATYNNITSSLVSTLEVNGEQFQVLPMVGTMGLEEPITGEILFGKYGRVYDLANSTWSNSILLVERGSDKEDEIVYFSDKEANASNAGAQAVVVYNKESGIFFGELNHEFSGADYQPTIPALSMSKEEGLKLRSMLEKKTVGILNIFYNPDFVAHFSSRGPVSPFYIKPDLVAPGAFVNTTLTEGSYNFTSGTSFAAPHVAGSTALLLQKNPDLTPSDIKSILVTTADPVSDAYGNKFPFEIGGTGRINVTKAFNADLIISPTQLIFFMSPESQIQSRVLNLKNLEGDLQNIKVSFEEKNEIEFSYQLNEHDLIIIAKNNAKLFGQFSNKVIIEHNGIVYSIPLLVHVSEGSISINENNGEINFNVTGPEDWSYAKISITNKQTGKFDTTSATPSKNAKLAVYETGMYWIESVIKVNDKTYDVYDTVDVNFVNNTKNPNVFDVFNIPEKPVIIAIVITSIIVLAGIKFTRI